MRVLVTGDEGYIGAVLGPFLRRAGHDVCGVDAGYYSECSFGPAAAGSAAHGSMRADIRDLTVDDFAGIDAVVHLAALSNDPLGELQPALTDAINTAAAARLGALARSAGVRRFLFASSCSIYGEGAGSSLTETDAFRPLTAYARSKVAVESALARLADDRFSPVFLRNATAYGFSPRLRLDLVVNNLTASACTTGEVRLLSDGTAWRPIVHVEDIARAFLAALEAPTDAIHNQAFNVGQNAENYQVRDIATAVSNVVGGSRVTFGSNASADSRTYHVSFDKIGRALPGFRPVWTLDRGIRELVAAFHEHGLDRAAFEGRAYTRLLQLKHLIETKRLDSDLRWTSIAEQAAVVESPGARVYS
jgi:nucleoside-diphosphate-sugar epimerase